MKRFKAYLLMGLAYIIACVAAWFVFAAITTEISNIFNVILGLFVADAAATVIVWAFGLIFKNSSFYDAYWSLMPWYLLLILMIRFNLFGISSIILFTVLSVWSWRLTINWAYTCEDITTQDWRYVMYKEQNKPFVWHIINFFGINFMPTLLVFLGLIPAIVAIVANVSFVPLLLIGAAIILLGTCLEFFADIQMHRFRKQNTDKDKVLGSGLWKYSRHPNYLGEITIWFGVYACMLAVDISYWYFGIGALSILALFYFISIPLMEKRQSAKRASYVDYQKTTSKLLLLPRKKIAEQCDVESAGE